jgi:hypothetical protein
VNLLFAVSLMAFLSMGASAQEKGLSKTLFAKELRMRDSNAKAGFDHIRGSSVDFTNLQINGALSLQRADIDELFLGSSEDPSILFAKSLDMDVLTVRRELNIRELTVDSFNAPGLQAPGRTRIAKLAVNEYANLKGAHFQYLIFDVGIRWPTTDPNRPQPAMELDGIGLSQIDVQKNGFQAPEAAWGSLLSEWLDKAAFSAQPYQELEGAFRSLGRTDLADMTFERMKDRERASRRLSSLGWLKSSVLSLLVRYGREPYRAFYFGLVIVVIGWIIFRNPKNMTPKQPQYATKPYSAFWYS